MVSKTQPWGKGPFVYDTIYSHSYCSASWGGIMNRKLIEFFRDESGATAVEYGLIAGVMAALLVTVLGLFGDKLKDLFGAIADKLSQAAKDVSTSGTAG